MIVDKSYSFRKRKSSRVVAQISGGLGNQLFQYTAGIFVSNKYGGNLLVENRVYYRFRRKFNRNYELAGFNLSLTSATVLDSLFFLMYDILERTNLVNLLRPFSSIFIFVRSDFEYENVILPDKPPRKIFLRGYFQNSEMARSSELQLFGLLEAFTPKDLRYSTVKDFFRDREVVALCYRAYEETSNPSQYSMGSIKKASDYQKVVNELTQQLIDPLFVVFSTKAGDFLTSLELPKDAIFVTGNEGYADPISNLWLMSHCKHFVFNNSTFYWWGAFLSKQNHINENQLIFAPDNFLNQGLPLKEWKIY